MINRMCIQTVMLAGWCMLPRVCRSLSFCGAQKAPLSLSIMECLIKSDFCSAFDQKQQRQSIIYSLHSADQIRVILTMHSRRRRRSASSSTMLSSVLLECMSIAPSDAQYSHNIEFKSCSTTVTIVAAQSAQWIGGGGWWWLVMMCPTNKHIYPVN